MRKINCFILPVVLSILGHGIFFSIFRGDISRDSVLALPNLYIVSSSQIKHEMTSSVRLTPLTFSLEKKNPLWSNTLNLTQGLPDVLSKSQKLALEVTPINFEKSHIDKNLDFSQKALDFQNEKVSPSFNELFYHKLPSGHVGSQDEKYIDLGEGIKLNYYIQGPVSTRELETTKFLLKIERIPVELKLRFWVSKNGKINQVVIEEESGFPVIDKKLINTVKKWRFKPVYLPSSPKYQWGVIKIKIQG